MKICGLQKLTLLDFPEQMACTIFTGGCNFKCPFCHNASLVLGSGDIESMEAEVWEHLRKRQGTLTGVCISGGEPTLQADIVPFIRRIKEMGYLVKLDTNGYRPEVLKELVHEGLVDYVAMDIKNSITKYDEASGIFNLDIDKIKESVEFLMSGVVDYEFRTTVVKELHTLEDFEEIGKWIQGDEKYYIQEYVDSGDILVSGYSAHTKEYMLKILNVVRKFVPNSSLRGQ